MQAALVEPVRHLQPIPRTLATATTVVFASSSVVLIEPAPFDILAVLLALTAVASGFVAMAPARAGLSTSLLAIFFFSNITPIVFTPIMDVSIFARFSAITLYLLALCSFVSSMVARYGIGAVRAIMNGIVIAAVFAALLGTAGFILSVDILLRYGRIQALFKDPNVFGPFLAFAALYMLIISSKPQTNLRPIAIACIALLLLGVLLSFSRAAWFTTIFALAVYASILCQQRGGAKLVMPTLLVLGGCAVAMALAVNRLGAYEFIQQRSQLNAYDQHRFAVQGYGLERALSWPFGFGPGQFDAMFISGLGAYSSHSLFVRVIFENGWLGLVAIASLCLATGFVAFWGSLRGSESLRQMYSFLAAAFSATICQSFVIDTLHWRHFWIQTGLVWGLYAFQRTHGRARRNT